MKYQKRINKHKNWRAFVLFVSCGRKCREILRLSLMRVQDLKTGPEDFPLSLPSSPSSLSIRRCDIYSVVVEERREGGRVGRREGGMDGGKGVSIVRGNGGI